jgi:hypothetical protein
VGRLPLTKRSCVVLTAAGVALAEQAVDQRDDGNAAGSKSGASGRGRALKPRWDRAARQLRVGGLLVKDFHQPARSQEAVLDALEELSWAAEIDDPLPRLRGLDPKRRLHDTVNSLNRRQKHRLIHFSATGNGTRIRWRFLFRQLPPELH